MTWPVSKYSYKPRCSLARSDILEVRDPEELLLVYIVYHRSKISVRLRHTPVWYEPHLIKEYVLPIPSLCREVLKITILADAVLQT